MSAHIAMASKICFASLAGVLVAASVVAVVRLAMRHGTNPAVSWRSYLGLDERQRRAPSKSLAAVSLG